MAKKDVRVIKTQMALVSAMLTLLERQDFQSITVNDLCTQAMVSRSTFYVYFEDKYALLEYCLTSLHRQLYPQADTLPLTLRQRTRDVLERVQENVKVFKNLMMVNFDTELFRRLQQSLQEDIEGRLGGRQDPPAHLPGPPELVSAFYAAGVMNAIMQWVRGGMPYTVDEMADCLNNLLPPPELPPLTEA